MKCSNCGYVDTYEEDRRNKLLNVNLTASWAKGQLRIITDMLKDRIDSNGSITIWFTDELESIYKRIQILDEDNF